MADQSALPAEVVALSALIWVRSRVLRGRLFHGVRRCPQRHDPLSVASDGPLCPQCSELHGETLMVAAKRLFKAIAAGRSSDELRETAMHRAARWTKDARDRLDAQAGLVVRPERLHTRRWFTTAVPDAVDREIVIDVLYFARSGDDCCQFEMPVARLAARFDLTSSEVARRLAGALTSIRAIKPEFLERNLDTPLVARAAHRGFPDEGSCGQLSRRDGPSGGGPFRHVA